MCPSSNALASSTTASTPAMRSTFAGALLAKGWTPASSPNWQSMVS